MIKSLNPASATEVTKPETTRANAPTASVPFAVVHAEAMAKVKDAAGPTGGVAPVAHTAKGTMHSAQGTGSATVAPGPPRQAPLPHVKIPAGETWEATGAGAQYARITGGPREGQYINLTRSKRRGETFRIVHANGLDWHIYNRGGKHVWIRASVDAHAIAKPKIYPGIGHDRPPKGEKWALVPGTNYADIIGGPRNGLYVNLSGNKRDGMAFQLVEQGGKWYHVYGSGKDRLWIHVHAPKHPSKHS